MKLAIVTALFVATAQIAFAADTAKLDYGRFSSSYEVELTDGGLIGSQEGLGGGSGKVEMAWKDGNWAGSFGFNRITSRSLKQRSENKMQYEFTVLPGGSYSAFIERKGEKTHISLLGPNGLHAVATLKNGYYLQGDNTIIGMDLQKKSESNWEGITRINYGRSIDTAETTLDAMGALNPEVLVATDPALFVILYVLPYNYAR